MKGKYFDHKKFSMMCRWCERLTTKKNPISEHHVHYSAAEGRRGKTVWICKKCHGAWKWRKVICEFCRSRYHFIKYSACWECNQPFIEAGRRVMESFEEEEVRMNKATWWAFDNPDRLDEPLWECVDCNILISFNDLCNLQRCDTCRAVVIEEEEKMAAARGDVEAHGGSNPHAIIADDPKRCMLGELEDG